MTTTTRTFCRLCEVGCGLVAHVDDDGALVELRPDHDHPVTHGFACSNGLVAADVHRDPARLRRPQRRADAGGGNGAAAGPRSSTSPGTRRPRRSRHDCGHWSTNTAHAPWVSTSATPMRSTRWRARGRSSSSAPSGPTACFSSASQDCSNKYATAELLYGVPQANPIADLDCTELLVVIGANPRVSKTSFLSVADPVRALRDIRDRGGSVVFVNPLRIEPAIGDTLQVRPDTDPYLLAAMLHEIDRTTGFTLGALDGDVVGVDDVRAFVRPYSPAAVAPVVGIPAEQIAELARLLRHRERRVDPRVDRSQHGPSGRARLLAGPDALVAHRQPRPSRRQLLRRSRAARSRRPRSTAPSRRSSRRSGVRTARPSG